MKTQLGFIGGGRITRIFLQAFTNKKANIDSVVVFDTNAEVLSKLKLQFPEITVATSLEEVARQSVVFVALHPPVIGEILELIKDHVAKDTIVVSLAPKFSIGKFSSVLGLSQLARMIPNATSYINEGYNPVCFSDEFDVTLKAELLDLLMVLGYTFEVEESKLEAYALLSAMLPTYFWFQWDELRRLGTDFGLTEEEAKTTIQRTVDVAMKTMFHSGLTPEEVTDLIPVKPMGDYENQIREMYREKLSGLFARIKS